MERLAARGIQILLNTRLESAEGGTIRLSDGQTFGADTLVWTAGVKPSPLAAESGFPVDGTGRIRTDAFLRMEGVEDAWAVGDAAAVPDRMAGGLMPPTAQHGMRQGKRVGDNVAAVLQGRRPVPFDYRGIGAVASLGRYKGVALIFGVRLRGFPAWFAHRTYHLYAMPTLTRKVKIAMDWTVALLFPRDLAQLGSIENPRASFVRAAGAEPTRTRTRTRARTAGAKATDRRG
jgi:NADH dehydrogenase